MLYAFNQLAGALVAVHGTSRAGRHNGPALPDRRVLCHGTCAQLSCAPVSEPHLVPWGPSCAPSRGGSLVLHVSSALQYAGACMLLSTELSCMEYAAGTCIAVLLQIQLSCLLFVEAKQHFRRVIVSCTGPGQCRTSQTESMSNLSNQDADLPTGCTVAVDPEEPAAVLAAAATEIAAVTGLCLAFAAEGDRHRAMCPF